MDSSGFNTESEMTQDQGYRNSVLKVRLKFYGQNSKKKKKVLRAKLPLTEEP